MGSSDSDTPLINYLAAARASHEMGDGERSDELLNEAVTTTKGADLAVGITPPNYKWIASKTNKHWRRS